MRKWFVGALGLVSIVATLPVAAVAIDADDRQDLKLFDFTTRKLDHPTGLRFRIDYGAPPSDQAVDKMVGRFERGTRYDPSVPELCEAPDEQLESQGAGACPAGSIVGEGVVRARAFNMEVIADVTLLNNTNEIIFLSEARGLPIPVRTVDRARVNEPKRKVIVETPDGFDLREVRLDVAKIADGDRGYLTTPNRCPDGGEWINKLRLAYRDGFKDEERERSPCK